MLLGRNWVVWQRRIKISTTNSKSTKACAAASYTFQSNPLAFQQSEYLFSLVCLSFFFPALSKHFDSFSHPIFHSIFFSFYSHRKCMCSLLVLFFCIQAALESVASFQILVYSNNFLILACHAAGVWLCRFFSLPSETLATLHVDDDDSVAFALSQTL